MRVRVRAAARPVRLASGPVCTVTSSIAERIALGSSVCCTPTKFWTSPESAPTKSRALRFPRIYLADSSGIPTPAKGESELPDLPADDFSNRPLENDRRLACDSRPRGGDTRPRLRSPNNWARASWAPSKHAASAPATIIRLAFIDMPPRFRHSGSVASFWPFWL
jgi:hypothetical protein